MNTTHLSLIEEYSSATRKSPATVCRLAYGSGNVLHRLHSPNITMTMRRSTRAIQWFSDHWPIDLLWPLDIPRPDPAPDSPAVQAMIARQNLNQTENESETNPLTALNQKGQIKDPVAFCKAISFGCAVQRASFDQVIHQYADGRPRAGRYPRKGSISADILKQLVAAGDNRFTCQIDMAKAFGGLR